MCRCRVFHVFLLAAVLCLAGAAAAEPSDAFERGLAAFEAERWSQAATALREEIEANPGHERAYILLGKALEEARDRNGAYQVWDTLLHFSEDEAVRREARKGWLRTRDYDPDQYKGRDPFDVGLNIDYRGLDEVDNDAYFDVYFPFLAGQPIPMRIPPIVGETKHFRIATCNEKLTKTLGDVCEQFLEFMLDNFLDGRAWPHRCPILCYKNHADYVSIGGAPPSSAGVTASNPLTGENIFIAFYQLPPDSSDKDVIESLRDSIEDTLGHELTHMVLHEFFGAQPNPRWLHEGTARQFEQQRDDFEEAARLARDSVSGEYIRFRDLFDAENYPTGGEVLRFYDQSASMVTFIAERGPEAFRAFLDELRLGNGYDAACSAALGIPEEGAVEEFERLWSDWMKRRYVKNLKEAEEAANCIDCEQCDECRTCDDDECEGISCVKCVKEGMNDDEIEDLPCRPRCWPRLEVSDAAVFRPGINLEATLALEDYANWVDLPIRSLDDFRSVDRSKRDWEVQGDRVRCNLPNDAETPSLLAVRIYEERPFVFRCKVRSTARGAETHFGLAQLTLAGDTQADLEEIGVQVLGPLQPNREYEVTGTLSSYLTLYLDGQCVGRFPAPLPKEYMDEIDHPIALIGYGPVEVWDMQAITMMEKPTVIGDEPQAEEEKDDKDSPRRPPRRPGRPGRL